MRLLMLGGTHFVGAAVVADAVRRGWDVTALHRGQTGTAPDGVESVMGDRTDPDALARLAKRDWDVVVDAWSAAPSVVRDSAEVLAPVAERYVYVSSMSVYPLPFPPVADESTPVVDADPDATSTEYAADKRGAELAVERAFGADRVIHGRAGLIVGPREDVGRLPWWLTRIARGGDVLAPGPADRPIQYVDARDLAAFLLDLAVAKAAGAYNVSGPAGAAAMRDLLETCVEVTGSDARLEWVDEDFLLGREVGPWVELPLWLPVDSEIEGLYRGEVAKALAAGLRPRPLRETVADTWAWLSGLGGPLPLRPDRPKVGLDPAKEADLLAAWATRRR